MQYQNLWEAAKAEFRGEFISTKCLNIYIQKGKGLSDLSFYLKKLEKEEQIQSKQKKQKNRNQWNGKQKNQ